LTVTDNVIILSFIVHIT